MITAWMTWEMAFREAFESSKATGRRYRVYRDRGVLPWWHTMEIAD